ncbi:PQQ-binding-like beta-propeller repeat protein [Fervidobacterium pennivorans subsp. carthaginiensis]|uniref:beta-alanine-activating enzyme beta-propeller domain-containing protein n=1 Tax=Fervidobacterium pennivorans TaxID=93466 RepID=UPI00355B75B9
MREPKSIRTIVLSFSTWVILSVFILLTNSCIPFKDTQVPQVSLVVSYEVVETNVNVKINIQFSDNELVDKIELYNGTEKVGEKEVKSKSGTEVFILTVPIEIDTVKQYQFKAKAIDKSGNSVESSTYNLTLDFRRPQLSIVNDYAGFNVDISIQSGPKVKKVEIYSNGNLVGVKETNLTSGSVTIPVTLPDDAQETVQLSAKATSEFGIVGEVSKTVIVDKVQPQVCILTTISEPYVSGTRVIDVEASDDKVLEKVEYYLNSTKIAERASSPFSISVDTTKYPDGEYTFKARAYDKAGNTNEATISFRIDNNPPSLSIKSLTNGSYISGIKNIEVSATDGNGISKVELYLNSNKIGEKTSSPYTFPLNATSYSDGQYTLKAVAYDIFSKRSETSIQVWIDNTPPSVSIISPTNGEVIIGIVEAKVNASDNFGISKVELYVGYSKVGEKTEAPYTFVFDTRDYLSGSYTLKAAAYDLAGNKKEASVNVTLQKPSAGDVIWKFKAGGAIYSCPAIDTNWGRKAIYFGSDDGYLYALSLDSLFKWKYKTNDWVHTSPAVDSDGTIYVGSDDGYLYAINPDGTIKWKHPVNGWARSSPALDYSAVYVATKNGEVYAIRMYDGTRKWKVQLGNALYSSPAIGNYGTIYIGCNDGYLYALDDWDGDEEWKFKTNGAIYSSPAIGSDGTIYVGSDDGSIYAVRSDGTLKWQVRTDDWVRSSPVIGSDGTVYAGSDDGYLYAINSNGTIKWTFKTNGYIRATPVIGSDGTIYLPSNDGYVYAISPDGKQKWKTFIGYNPSYATLDDNGTLYVGTDDGYLHAIYTGSSYHSLAYSDWPKFRRNLRNTGKVWDSLR